MTASRNSPLSSRWAAFPAAAVLAFLTAYGIGQAWAGEHIKGSGVVRTETRDVNGFRGVALDVPANVTLRQGAGEGVSIKGDDNVVPLVQTVVEDGTLRIRWVRRNLSIDFTSLDIVVDTKSIDALAVRGSGQLRAAQLKAGTLHAAVDGSGRITFDTLDVDSLDVAIRGNGRLAAAGRADALDVAIAGSGDLVAAKLHSRHARVSLMGSAKATVWAQDALDATIAGSGEIKYHGKPRLTQTLAGSGRIRPAGTSI